MPSLQEIESMLNIKVGNKCLKDGKHNPNKNKYYYFKDEYYIVELSHGRWMICDDCKTTRKLLKKYCWDVGNNGLGNAKTQTNQTWYQLFFEDEDLFAKDYVSLD